MPGIFGYFDPDGSLPSATADQMMAALSDNDKGGLQVKRASFGCIGIVNFAGADLIESNLNKVSYCMLGKLDETVERNGISSRQGIARYYFAGSEGPKKLSNCRGNFAAALLNDASKSIVLITDHFGSYPLYIYEIGRVVYFASQLKCILAVVPIRPSFDNISVSTMLSIGEVVGNRTLVKDIHTLDSASVFTMSLAGNKKSKYWVYEYQEDQSCDWNQSLIDTGHALSLAVGRALEEQRKFAVPLSGGLDSRFILELAHQHDATLKAYTWGTPKCRDVEYAKDIAMQIGCPHETLIFKGDYLSKYARLGVWLSEGHTPATNFHVLPYVDHMASEGINAILDGFAGDVVLGGNFISSDWLDNPGFCKAGKAIWQWRRAGFDSCWESSLLNEYHEIGMGEFETIYRSYPGNSAMDKAMAFLIDNRLRRITICGTELFRPKMLVRQPFMDVDFMNVISKLPHEWRRRHRFYLAVLNKFAHRSARSPYQRTMLAANSPYWLSWASLAFQRGISTVANKFGMPVFRQKSPSDFPGWFRGVLRPYVGDLLNSEQTLDRGVVPADLIRQVLTLHMEEKRDLSSLIGAIITIEMFARLFFDNLNESIQDYDCGSMMDSL